MQEDDRLYSLTPITEFPLSLILLKRSRKFPHAIKDVVRMNLQTHRIELHNASP